MGHGTFRSLVWVSFTILTRCDIVDYHQEQASSESSNEELQRVNHNNLKPHYIRNPEGVTTAAGRELPTSEGSGQLLSRHQEPQFKRLVPIGFNNDAFVDISDDFADFTDDPDAVVVDAVIREDTTEIIKVPEQQAQINEVPQDELVTVLTPSLVSPLTAIWKSSSSTTEPFARGRESTVILQPISEEETFTTSQELVEAATFAPQTPLNGRLVTNPLPFTVGVNAISRSTPSGTTIISAPVLNKPSATSQHFFKVKASTHRPFRNKLNDGEVRHRPKAYHKRRSGLTSSKNFKLLKKNGATRAVSTGDRAAVRRVISHDVPPLMRKSALNRGRKMTLVAKGRGYLNDLFNKEGFEVQIRKRYLG